MRKGELVTHFWWEQPGIGVVCRFCTIMRDQPRMCYVLWPSGEETLEQVKDLEKVKKCP